MEDRIVFSLILELVKDKMPKHIESAVRSSCVHTDCVPVWTR